MSYLDSSHFSNRFRHIICQILIYRFKDINYSILNKKEKNKSFYCPFEFKINILILVVYVGNCLEFKK
jgi:hypothetical protein